MYVKFQYGYIIGNYLQATDQDIRDFFWTGSGDGPSAVNPFERFPISEDAIIKTATVVATVYIDRNAPPDGYDDLCIFDCPPSVGDHHGHEGDYPSDDGGDYGPGLSIDNVTPTDRRFWLMTVIGGLYGRQDYPMLESKLARLYRVAFARQQALHLGINGSSSSNQHNNTLERQSMDSDVLWRTKRRVHQPPPPPQQNSGSPNENVIARGGGRSRGSGRTGHRGRKKVLHKRDTGSSVLDGLVERVASEVLPVPPVVEIIGSQSEQSPEGSGGSGAGEPEEPLRSLNVDGAMEGEPGPNRTVVRRNQDKDAYSTGRRKVRILIHNTTHLREEDRLSMDDDDDVDGRDANNRLKGSKAGTPGGARGRGAGSPDTANPLLNQTEIIYSVFVGGLPVLATTAAEDMKLMSQDEMEHVLETMVYLKADPYLKEPQATPLIPSTQNGSGNVIALIGQNPSLFVVSCVAALLLLVLCVGLFLLARGKRKHITELKKLESTQALVMPGTISEELNALKTGESGSSRQPSPYARDPSGSVGLMAHKPSPTIHFPLPPMTRPTSSCSSYSSDSSVYYPKRKLKHQHHHHHHHHQHHQAAQQQTLHHELLDEKAVNLSNKLQRQFPPTGAQENVYASVQKPKKEHKRRRKYLGENRVGSFEGGGLAPPPRSPLTTTTASSGSPSDRSYDGRQPALVPALPYGHHPSETLNTDVILKHYLKRKPLVGYGDGHGLPVEALNRDKIRLLEGTVSVDSGSIGSYLSMASVKSFPRCFVPEPLSRVLEPVTMTHLDQSDVYADGMKSTGPDTAGTSQYNTDTEVHLSRTQSDGADPGVVGPIVWQMHKREMDEIASPMRDPFVTRNRFEGLLEGAMQLYTEGPEREEEQKNSIPLPGVIRPVENRGKSAVVVRETSRSSSATIRPVTAAPGRKPVDKPSEYPPSPGAVLGRGGGGGGGAWGSGTHSPLVRPMSAGPFHSPQGPPALEVTRITAPQSVLQSTDLSTAPLLQNIMQELKRFRNEPQ
ncbi:AGAP006655-PA-like protein [Anopheles sinensis]|uniref:AGAP006655-PA-like protein n=1 Tax=Anopheles sinensis TaxID=74873 RepID=A0A084WS28_ANOSI|nr:AGAP006655-PA-like protein [Anopheles sinensis]